MSSTQQRAKVKITVAKFDQLHHQIDGTVAEMQGAQMQAQGRAA